MFLYFLGLDLLSQKLQKYLQLKKNKKWDHSRIFNEKHSTKKKN